MPKTTKYAAVTFLILSFPFNSWAYDDVKLEKIIPLVDKKSSPKLLHLDSDKRMWVINQTNQSIEQITPEGRPTIVLMPAKKPTGGFKEPIDFAFLSDGSMLVADRGFKRIVIIGPEKKSTPPVISDWKKIKVLGQFALDQEASALAVAHDDAIAVAFKGQSSIDIFSVDGVLLHRLFPGEKYPLKNVIALDYSMNGQLWALEEEKGALHRFLPDRKWLGATDGFDGPLSLTVDDYGYAYVGLSQGKWKEVGPDGTVIGTFGAKGKNPGEMLRPVGIAALDGSHLWVAEAGNIRLQSFIINNKEKKKLLLKEPAAFVQARLLSQWEEQVSDGLIGSNGDILLLNSDKVKFEWVDPQGNSKSNSGKKGKGTAGFLQPHSMAKDAMGKIWVSDENDHTIKLISEAGVVEKSVGQKGKKEGGLISPSYIYVRADGSFLVADKDNSRVQVLSDKGLFLFQVGSNGNKDGQFSSLAGLAANEDLIALLDSGRKSLLFFNSSGKFSFEISNKAGKASYWTEPTALTVDSDGRFLVLDKGAGRIRIFNRKGQFLADVAAKGNRLASGPGHKVLVIADKTVFLYEIHMVPRLIQNVTVGEVEGDMQVSWDNSFEAHSYAIYRSSTAGFNLLTKVENPPFSDRQFTPAVMYTYAVVGINDNGNEGNWSLTKPMKAPKRRDVSLISIDRTDLKPVFTAASKFYVSNPIGEITVRNNDEKGFRNVKLSLGLKKYTDFPTEVVIPEVGAGESKSIPVTMTFNDQVFELTEDTPVQMDVRVSYFEDNFEKSISQNVPVTLYSRNAISWTDRARIASFITPKDPPVLEFARAAIRDQIVLLKGSTVGKPLAKVALFFEAVSALGVSYVPDPKNPYDQASVKTEMLDYVQFPRETLRRKTGDCDDTSALFAALLQSVGVSAAMIDMPGHILLMADTEETDIAVLGLPEERFVKFQGTYWVPIETTKLGQGFLTAWQSGATRVATEKDKNSIQFVPVSQAAEKYPPVTLVDAEKEPPVYPAATVQKNFPALLKLMENERFEGKLKDIKARIEADNANRMLQIELGMVYVEGKKIEEGNKVFVSLLKEDEPVEVQSAARNNLGNLAYLDANYQEAAVHYEKASTLSTSDGGILINRGRTAWRLGEKEAAIKLFQQGSALVPEWRDYVSDIPSEYLPK